MPHTSPKISLITVNYNGEEDSLEFIASLQKSTLRDWELFVVDNASHRSPCRIGEIQDDRIQLIALSENKGFAGGNNVAVPKCSAPYLFFVNNDTILTPDCLEILHDTAEEIENLGALSPKFHYYHQQNLIEFAGCTQINRITARNTALHNREIDNGVKGLIETHYAHGAGMLIPKKVIETVGTMHEAFFLYYEEMDWCERIRKAGYQIYCQRDALIYHKESASVGKLNPLKTYYLNRNRILFMNRNFPYPSNFPFLLFLIFISIPTNFFRFLVKGEIDHLKAYLKGIYWHINSKSTI
ncbi:glycosyltransferase family 2 protein [Luteibaculum oceani]|uniref:Glycosyltransferase family 2 protein n=1 Tax=Luteibaculum oceani TaxID=1294296 RepID=A0A5C6UU26_9FLAO|nr:glycosyltransferase family 2 protein [Luteibaculum oceani]TXC76100.1 glycosyltransferase family 2 protein [Luteibaculum oceani]